MQKVFAFVFARGGSKGLPKKNILPIGGLPLVCHSIKMAQAIPSVQKVFVSTDCDEIANASVATGAEIIKRPAELATDHASEWNAWQHAVQTVLDADESFDVFLSLPATSPLRRRCDVEKCLSALTESFDGALLMTESSRNPWFNMVNQKDDQSINLVNQCTDIVRRQDAPKCYDLTTVAYAMNPSFVLSASRLWDGNIAGVEMPKDYSIDIDTQHDFNVAQIMYEQLMQSIDWYGAL